VNVYPVNAFEASTLASPQRATHSRMSDLFGRYIDYTVDFNSASATIEGAWNRQAMGDTFIIGNTNAHSGTAHFRLNGGGALSVEFETEGRITIAPLGRKCAFDSATITLQGASNLYVGLLFVGDKWELPRFAVHPARQLELRGEGGRTFAGQARGIPAETLRTFGAEFARIPGAEAKTVADYADGVQNVIPHVIDPYPEARGEFPPMFATLSGYGEQGKRAENSFFWDYQMSWREAR